MDSAAVLRKLVTWLSWGRSQLGDETTGGKNHLLLETDSGSLKGK